MKGQSASACPCFLHSLCRWEGRALEATPGLPTGSLPTVPTAHFSGLSLAKVPVVCWSQAAQRFPTPTLSGLEPHFPVGAQPLCRSTAEN